MIDEISLRQKQERSAQAEALLRSELLQEAFTGLRDDYVKTWATTAVKDVEARERLWMAVNIIGKIQEQLAKHVRDGRIATQDLANIKYLKR